MEEHGGLPKFVVDEFEQYLDCGRLEKGCLLLECRACGYSQLVALSCKRRSICNSCVGRRMADTAVHLERHVLPEVPVRHWICSLPWGLRALLGYDRVLCSEVLSAFIAELSRSLNRRAKQELGLSSVARAPEGETFASVISGWGHTCGILESGETACWGNIAPAPEGVAFGVLASGESHLCGLRVADGKAQCWGVASGGTNAPANVRFKNISARGHNTCALRAADGVVQCWGNDDLQTSAPAEELLSVVVGEHHACGVRADSNRVQCWGDVVANQLSPAPDLALTCLASGDSHTCGLRTADGVAECWGSDGSGRATPPEGVAFRQISAGGEHTCAVRALDGGIECWGNSHFDVLTPPADFP